MSIDKIRIALITVWYPPTKSIAVNRMHAFAKYLSAKEDIHVSVFTMGEVPYMNESKSIDVFAIPSSRISKILISKTTDNIYLHKIKTAFRILYIKVAGSPFENWRIKSIKNLIEVDKLTPFDCIISSYSPEDAHLLAIEFIEKIRRIPWIADMRDEMSLNPGLSLSQKKKLADIEVKVNKHASAITSVSGPILDDFRSICPKVNFFEEIRNGFDHTFQPIHRLKNSYFSIGYFGTFYGARKPCFFFEGLCAFKKKYSAVQFKIMLYGVHHNFTIPTELVDYVSIEDSLSYSDAIVEMSKMDVNLLILPSGVGKGVYSGKIFDYISVHKPVFACVDIEDVAAELIMKLECGYVADFYSVDEIFAQLELFYFDWLSNVNKSAKKTEIDKLNRKSQIEKLENLIRRLV